MPGPVQSRVNECNRDLSPTGWRGTEVTSPEALPARKYLLRTFLFVVSIRGFHLTFRLAYLVTVQNGGFPWIAELFMLALLLYQLGSGRLLNMTWGVWLTREARPQMYWAVLGIYAAIVLAGF